MNLLKLDPEMIALDLVGDDERGYDFVQDEDVVALKRIAAPWGVLSAYLDLHPERMDKTKVLTDFRHGLEAIRERHQDGWSHDQRTLFEAMSNDLVERLDTLLATPKGKALALFTVPRQVQPKKGQVDYDLIRIFHLPDQVKSRVSWGDSADLAPLLVQRAEHPDTGLVLFDRERARFFLHHMGESAEYTLNLVNSDRVPLSRAHVWHGYGEHNHHQWQEVHYQRYLHNASLAVTKVADLAGWTWLVLASPDEQEAKHLLERLPAAWQEKVIGTLALPMNANLNQVRDALAPVVKAAQTRRERELVEAWQGELARGEAGRAVAGLDDTLLAVQEYRVATLLQAPDVSVDGWRCADCGGLIADSGDGRPDGCPYCGHSGLRSLPDLVGEMALDVLASGGEVELVNDSEARAAVEEKGGLGGLLRY